MMLKDYALEAFPVFFDESPASSLPLDGAVSSIPEASSLRFYRLPRWETVYGTVLSLLLHASLLLAAIVIPITAPQPASEPQFVMVTFAEEGAAGPGGADGRDAGERGEGSGPAIGKKDPQAPSPPAVPEVPPPPAWAAVEKPAPLIPRQLPRNAKPKAEKQKAVSPASAQAPQALDPAQPETAATNQGGTDASRASAALPGAGDGAGTDRGDGAGIGGGKGGSHHGVGTGVGEFTIKQVDHAPVVLRKVEPEYPETARKMGLAGRVVAKFLVGADGRVSRVSILQAAPEGIFEPAVLKALKQWEFKPGSLKNRAVATWVVLPINFRHAR